MNELRSTAAILFLDDEDAILASLRSLFRREGYTLHFFHSGPEALTFLQHNSVEAIVTDMRMPDMNGAEFLKRATNICPAAVRIMLSGYEDKAVVISALSDGLAQYYVLKPWDDVGFRTLIRQAVRLQQSPLDQRLKEMFCTSTILQSQPKFHVHLLEMLSKEESSLNDIVEAIENSPVVVAKLLRVANSVYFAARNPITTVREAAIFIGVKYIINLVMAIETFQSVGKGIDSKYTHFVEEIWSTSLRRAAIAKMIGEQWKGFNNGHLSYVTSLLQDIGYAVRLSSEPEKYRAFMEHSKLEGISKYEAEVKVFTIPHDEVGAALLEFWNLPPEIEKAIARHHRNTEDEILVQILQIADALVCADSSNPHDPAIDPLITKWREQLDQPATGGSTIPQPT